MAAAPIAAAIATGHPGPALFGIMGIGMCGVTLLPAVYEATEDRKFVQIGFSKFSSVGILLLTTALGVSLGIGHTLGFFNPFVISAFVGTSLLLAAMIFYSDLNRTKVIARYRQSEPHLARQFLNFKEQTVSIPIDNKNLIFSLFTDLLLLGSLQTSAAWAGVVGGVVAAVVAGSVTGAAVAFGAKAMNEDRNGYLGSMTGSGAAVAVVVGFLVGILAAFVVGNQVEEAVKMINAIAATPTGFVILALRTIWLGAFFGWVAKKASYDMSEKGFSHSFTIVFLVLTVAFGIIAGIVIIQTQAGLLNPFKMLALAGTGISLAIMIFYPRWQRGRIIAKYRQLHPYLIKP